MGVRIDEAGRDDQSTRIDDICITKTHLGILADINDAIIANGDVERSARCAATIKHKPARDNGIGLNLPRNR